MALPHVCLVDFVCFPSMSSPLSTEAHLSNAVVNCSTAVLCPTTTSSTFAATRSSSRPHSGFIFATLPSFPNGLVHQRCRYVSLCAPLSSCLSIVSLLYCMQCCTSFCWLCHSFASLGQLTINNCSLYSLAAEATFTRQRWLRCDL